MTRWIYLGGFLSYCLLVIWVGWRGYQKSKHSTDVDVDFWAAGKSLTAWSAGLSISASFMSISWSCVYTVQLFYWYGVSALWLVPIPWLLTMAGFYFFTPWFRRFSAFSQPEMLAQRFGNRVRPYFAIPLAFVFMVWGGAEIYVAAQILSPLLQVSFHIILLVITLVVAIYSYLGGFSAVVVTDKVQYALVAFFIFAMAILAGYGVINHSDLNDFFVHLPYPVKTNRSAFNAFAVGLPLIIITLIAYLPGWLVETDIWLRLQAAKSTKQARESVLIASLNSFLFLALLPLLIGLAALYLYPPVNHQIPARLNDGAAIFSVLLQDFAPYWLGVLLIVGLAAASMSTIDTCGNVVALSLSYDFFEPFLSRKKPNFNRRKFVRFMSAGAIFLAYFYSLFTESLWDIFYLSSGILTTTLFIPMMAIFRKQASSRQITTSALFGFLSTLIFYFLEKNQILTILEPAWMENTGLGYILFAMVVSWVGYVSTG